MTPDKFEVLVEEAGDVVHKRVEADEYRYADVSEHETSIQFFNAGARVYEVRSFAVQQIIPLFDDKSHVEVVD